MKMRKLWRVFPAVTAGVAIILAATALFGAQSGERRVMTFQKGEVFLLPEIGAVILKGDDGFYVEMAPPPERRSKEYRGVDLLQKDLILMFNGKKIKSIADFQERYDSLAVGDEIKLGIKRGKDMRIVTLAKMDQSKTPQTHRIMLGGDADAEAAQATGAPQKEITMSWSGDSSTDIVALPELGLVFTEQDSAVVVASILPNAAALFGDKTPAEGDVIKSIGDQAVNSVKIFHELYEKIAIGDPVKLQFVHDKKAIAVAVPKAEAPKQKMIIQK